MRTGTARKRRSSAAPGAARPGFTILETMVALGILAMALTLVAQISLWSLRERTRSAVRQEALEFAANVLEAARACSWEALTPEWGAAQQLPPPLAQRLVEGRLRVRVESEASRPHSKRVTVEVYGKREPRKREPVAQLVGLFSARTAARGGEKP